MRAILDGRKTQTRRVVNPQPEVVFECGGNHPFGAACDYCRSIDARLQKGPKDLSRCPYGKPGTKLWVREPIKIIEWRGFRQVRIQYVSDGTETGWMDYPARLKGTASTLLNRGYPYGAFREAARIMLEIVSVRAERLQEISWNDMKAEGAPEHRTFDLWFTELWNSINAKRGFGWETDPWVWAIEFRKI